MYHPWRAHSLSVLGNHNFLGKGGTHHLFRHSQKFDNERGYSFPGLPLSSFFIVYIMYAKPEGCRTGPWEGVTRKAGKKDRNGKQEQEFVQKVARPETTRTLGYLRE